MLDLRSALLPRDTYCTPKTSGLLPPIARQHLPLAPTTTRENSAAGGQTPLTDLYVGLLPRCSLIGLEVGTVPGPSICVLIRHTSFWLPSRKNLRVNHHFANFATMRSRSLRAHRQQKKHSRTEQKNEDNEQTCRGASMFRWDLP